MSTRQVFVRFDSNVGVFASAMEQAAAATRSLQEASTQLAAAQAEAGAQANAFAATYSASLAKVQAAETEQAAAAKALADQQIESYARVVAAQQSAAGAEAANARWRTQNSQQAADGAVLNSRATVIAESQAVAEKEALYQTSVANLDTVVNEEAAILAREAAEYKAAAVAVAEAEAQKAAAIEASMAASQAAWSKIGTFALYAGLAGVAGFALMGKAAMDFQSNMNQAAAVSDFTRAHLDDMSNAVMQLSRQMPFSANEFAKALTTVEQAGFQGSQAIDILRVAGEGAEIGFSSLGSAAEDITRVLNGYELSANQAAAVNDLLVGATKNGIGSYHEFADALAQMAPEAHALGIPLQQVTAAIAAMSTESTTAQASGMGLLRMLFSLDKTGGDASKALLQLANAQGQAKFTTAQQVFESQGLVGVLKMIGNATDGQLDALARFFPSIRQLKTALSLTSDEGQRFQAVMDTMSNSEQLAAAEVMAFEQQQQSASNQMKIAENTIQDTAITLGQDLLPVISGVARGITELFSAFDSLPGPLKDIVTYGGLAAATFTLMFGLASKIVPGVQSIVSSFAALTAARKTESTAAQQQAATDGAADAERVTTETSATIRLEALQKKLAVARMEEAGAEEEGTATLLGTEAAAGAATGGVAALALGLTALVGGFALFSSKTKDNTQDIQEWTDALNKANAGDQSAIAGLLDVKAVAENLGQTLQSLGIDVTTFNQSFGGPGLANMQAQQTTIEQMTQAIVTYAQTHAQAVADARSQSGGTPISADGITGNLADASKVSQALTDAFNGNSGAAERLQNQFKGLFGDTNDVDRAFGYLVGQTKAQQDALAQQAAQQKLVATQRVQYNSSLWETGTAIQTGVDPSVLALTDDEKKLQTEFRNMVSASEAASAALKQTQEDTTGIVTSQKIFQDVMKSNTDAVSEQAQVLYDAYQQSQNDIKNAASDTTTAVKRETSTQGNDWLAVGQTAKDTSQTTVQAAEDQQKAIDRQVTANKKSLDDFKKQLTGPDGITVSMGDYLTGLQKSAEKTKTWNENLKKIAAAGGSSDLITELRKLGDDGASAVQGFADAADAASKEAGDSISTNIPDAIKKANDAIATLTPATKASFEDVVKQMGGQLITATQMQNNYLALGRAGKTALANELLQMGPAGSDAMAQAVQDLGDPLKKGLVDSAETAAEGVQKYYDANGEFSHDLQMKFTVLGQLAGAAGGSATGHGMLDAVSGIFKNAGVDPAAIASFIHSFYTEIVSQYPNLAPYLQQIFQQNGGQGNLGQPTELPPGFIGPPAPGEVSYGWQSHKYRQQPNADGNIWHFQGGGTTDAPHVAQIAKPGDWRVWAEPETGGEAYIPLGMSKRGQSTEILKQVAKQFGYVLDAGPQGWNPQKMYADGGIWNGETWNRSRPAGASMLSGGTHTTEMKVVHVEVKQPVSHTTEYAFNGPIQGYSLEQVTRDAESKSRLAALTNGG